MDNLIKTKTTNPAQAQTSLTKPYPPSFTDRFMGFVLKLPIPYWLTYLLLFFLQSLINHIVAWITGWIPSFQFNPMLLIFPVWLWTPLITMTYLNSVSLEALASFRTLLDIDDGEFKRLKDEFITMPARSVILSGVFWSIVYLILNYLTYQTFFVGFKVGLLLGLIIFIQGLVSYSIGSAIYYHSFRLLRLVNRTVKMVKKFDLFQLDPIYDLSRVTSITGISWMVMLTLTLLTFPIQFTNTLILAILVIQVVLALAAFVVPLRLVIFNLISEKRRLLSENSLRFKTTLDRLHMSLEKNEMAEVVQLNNALTGLNTEQAVLTRIPILPWRVGTLPRFLSTIALPIVLFLIQLAIKNWLGG